jgi:hypothetical protein
MSKPFCCRRASGREIIKNGSKKSRGVRRVVAGGDGVYSGAGYVRAVSFDKNLVMIFWGHIIAEDIINVGQCIHSC